MRYAIVLLAVFVLLGGSQSMAKIGLEVGFDQAHTSNLLKNAGQSDAWYTTPRAAFLFYPIPTMEVSLNGEYTVYYGLDDDVSDL